jgi:hypothetical protein
MAMVVERSSRLPRSAARVWEAVQRPALMVYEAAPVIHFRPIDPPVLPDRLEERRYLASLWLFGFLPMGRQWIVVSLLARPESHYGLRDNGYSALIKRWDHHILIDPIDGDNALYTDRIEIEAGLLTPFVWAFASVLFWHRQRRLRALAARDFAGLL